MNNFIYFSKAFYNQVDAKWEYKVIDIFDPKINFEAMKRRKSNVRIN